MNAKYWQKGETLDYTPTAAVKNGAVVSLGTRIGIAGSDIAANEPGQVHVVGVFEMDKDGTEIALGAAVYYDKATDKITTTASVTTGESGSQQTVNNTPAGYAVQAAAAADATVLVKLLG